jgi:hypothetical protein
MDPAAILIVSSFVVMILTLLGVSYKTGFVSYSIWSLTRDDQPKFAIRKDRALRFVGITFGIMLLNIVYGLIVVRDVSEIGGILVLSLFNTVVIAYGLSFWILLTEKPKS